MTTTKIWECKIGEVDSVAGGADYPMRQAVAVAYREITGAEPVFIFSGWGALLTEAERAVVEAGKDTDGEDAPAGLYAWLAEYPEEGMLFIDPDAPAPAPANAPEQMPSERNCVCDPYVHLDGYSGGAAKEGLYGALWVVAEGVRKKYVLADQVSEPKAMPVPATTPEQKRPINCGTGHCSCIECVMPDGPLYQPATAPALPSWQDAPTKPGMWACLYMGELSTAIFNAYEIEHFDRDEMVGCRWRFIPEDKP